MKLEFSVTQQALLSDALYTRMQRIEKMIALFEQERDAKSKQLVEAYSQEYLDAECLLQIISQIGK